MKQSEVEAILAKVEASMEASHRAQVELLQAVRLLFVEKQVVPEPRAPLERNQDIELAPRSCSRSAFTHGSCRKRWGTPTSASPSPCARTSSVS